MTRLIYSLFDIPVAHSEPENSPFVRTAFVIKIKESVRWIIKHRRTLCHFDDFTSLEINTTGISRRAMRIIIISFRIWSCSSVSSLLKSKDPTDGSSNIEGTLCHFDDFTSLEINTTGISRRAMRIIIISFRTWSCSSVSSCIEYLVFSQEYMIALAE